MNNINKLKRAIIKEELVALTGDFTKAVILNQFIYWSERVRDIDKFIEEEIRRLNTEGMDSNISKQHGWIYKTAEELSEETMLGLSPSTIRRHVKVLVEKGWLSERKNPKYRWDNTLQYRPNIIKIQKDLHSLGYSLEGYPLQLEFEKLEEPCNPDNSRIFILENGISKTKNHAQQNEKTIPEITIKTTNKNKEIYIGDEGTNVLNETKDNDLIAEDSLEDNSPYQDSDISDLDSNVNLPSLDKEALEVFSLLPRQDSDLVEFILEYRKLRFKYSKEYLMLIIDRYKKSKELKGENIYHKPENFFRCGEYKNYLDENWENTLDECNKIAAMRRQKPSAKKSGSNEPQVSCEWDQQLKDLDW